MSLDSLDAPTADASSAGLLQLTVADIRDETHDVKTFVFRAEGGVPVYAAGQSMTLKLAIGGETLFRTFSLASAPDLSGTIAMTIKAHAKGRATRWLHDELRGRRAARRPAAEGPLHHRQTHDRQVGPDLGRLGCEPVDGDAAPPRGDCA